MKTKTAEFEVLVPNPDGTGVAERVKVPVRMELDEELGEWLLTAEAHQIIEDTKARRMGLLLPYQFKELRERYGYTQKQMGELFRVGEKSWTRWESGKQRPSHSINLLIRALYDGELSINYLLKRAGKPLRTDIPPHITGVIMQWAGNFHVDISSAYSPQPAEVNFTSYAKPVWAGHHAALAALFGQSDQKRTAYEGNEILLRSKGDHWREQYRAGHETSVENEKEE